MRTIFISADKRGEVERLIRSLPAILAGRAADVGGLAHGLRMRIAFAFFSLVKEAFIVKSRGGTDAAGISWPPLSREYLAYQRPHTSRQPPRAGGLAPGGKDGFMTSRQLEQWRKDYSAAIAYLSLQVPLAEAKGRAAAIAWNKAKAAGVRTKLDVFGNRPVEILRDRGILFNSLSPGLLSEQGADANYSPPEGQVVEQSANYLIVGTNVEYAYYHQEKPGRRPLWPKDGSIPAAWMDEILEVAVTGLIEIGDIVARG